MAVLAGQVLRQAAVRPAELRFVYWQGDHPQKAWVTAIQRGRFVHYVVGFADDPAWEERLAATLFRSLRTRGAVSTAPAPFPDWLSTPVRHAGAAAPAYARCVVP